MQLNPPTKIGFILAVILAIISLLPMIGIPLGAFGGVYSYWMLLLAFVSLAAANLLSGL
jgi:hypothetical protein